MSKWYDPVGNFLAKIKYLDNGCWEWQANRGQGYGYCSLDGKLVRAHRFAYRLFIGEIPRGLVLDHLCENKACVNPEHLEAVTVRENRRRRMKPYCNHGHAFDEKNTRFYNNRRHCRECERVRSRRRRQLVCA